MSELKLPNPDGLEPGVDAAFDQIIAPLQAWANQEGHWFDVGATTEDFSIAGASNTWSIPGLPDTQARYLAYMIVGNTMFLNVYIPSSSLTVTTAVTNLGVRIPGNYKASGPSAGTSTTYSRMYTGMGMMINGGTQKNCRMFVLSDSQYVYIEAVPSAVLVTDTGLYLQGAIAFKVIPA